MNHENQVDLIIDSLLDVKYMWAGLNAYRSAAEERDGTLVRKSKSCLVNSDDSYHPICALDTRVDYTRFSSVVPDNPIDPDTVCQYCLSIIRSNPKRYGFTHPEGILIIAKQPMEVSHCETDG
jgi:hypothetical protein